MKLNEKLTQDLREQIGNLSNLNTTNKDSLVGAINEKKINKLWENPNMNSGYTTGTIELSSDDYDYLIWICEGYNGWKRMISYMAPKGFVPELFYSGSGQLSDGINWRIANYERIVTRIDDTHFQVALPSLTSPNGDSYSNNGINNGMWIIPRYIYGGKF